MKRNVSIFLVLVLILCLVACTVSEENESNLPEKNNNDIFIWTDEETGVQYIVYADATGYCGMGGITPRLNADGTLYVTTESEETP